MAKLFVSLPMRNRDEFDILEEMKDLRMVAEANFDEEFELIDSYVNGNPPSDILNESVWYLAKSIDTLAQADLVIFSPEWSTATGCIIEHMICAFYNIPYVEVHPSDILDLSNAEVIMDYTHDLDEQPIEIVDKIDILHEDNDEYLNAIEELAEPDLDTLEPDEYNADIDDYDDELEPGEYNADLEK
ncbi:MAG: hypothetical protein J6U54_12040 [Clostridiales bacterium]|nr:hypothetical protein [Clostridiales bacterium]